MADVPGGRYWEPGWLDEPELTEEEAKAEWEEFLQALEEGFIDEELPFM